MIRRLLLLTLGAVFVLWLEERRKLREANVIVTQWNNMIASLEHGNEELEAYFSRLSPEEYLEHQWYALQYDEQVANAKKESAS